MENKNVELKVCVCGGGGAQTYHCPLNHGGGRLKKIVVAEKSQICL